MQIIKAKIIEPDEYEEIFSQQNTTELNNSGQAFPALKRQGLRLTAFRGQKKDILKLFLDQK